MSASNLCLSRSFRDKEGDQFAENNPLLAATARDIRADVNQNCPTGMPQITAWDNWRSQGNCGESWPGRTGRNHRSGCVLAGLTVDGAYRSRSSATSSTKDKRWGNLGIKARDGGDNSEVWSWLKGRNSLSQLKVLWIAQNLSRYWNFDKLMRFLKDLGSRAVREDVSKAPKPH